MYCRGQLVQLQHDRPVLERAGYGLAAISYDSVAVLREFASRKGITFPLLADHESNVIRTFGVLNRRYPKGTLLDVTSEQITNALGDVPVYGVDIPVRIRHRSPRQACLAVRFRNGRAATHRRCHTRTIHRRAHGREPAISVEGPCASRRDGEQCGGGSGSRLWLGLELKPPSGFHLYAPEVGRSYHGLEWKMDESSCWYQSEPAYPKPQWRHFAFEENDLPVYEGDIRINRELVLKPVLSAAEPSLFHLFQNVCLDSNSRVKALGVVSFQACDERQCYPPQSVPVEWKFHFVPPDMVRASPELRREFEP